jgi:hypothetical protein
MYRNLFNANSSGDSHLHQQHYAPLRQLALVTRVYSQTHTLRESAAHGIDVPVQVAAKQG